MYVTQYLIGFIFLNISINYNMSIRSRVCSLLINRSPLVLYNSFDLQRASMQPIIIIPVGRLCYVRVSPIPEQKRCIYANAIQWCFAGQEIYFR